MRPIERVKTEKSIRAMQIKVPPVRFASCPRTTLMKFDFGWEMHELTEDWRQAERERRAQILQWEVERALDHHEQNINEFDVFGITFVFRR